MRIRLESEDGALSPILGPLDTPGLAPGSRLHALVKNCLVRRNPIVKGAGVSGVYWPAEYFGLNHSSLFRSLNGDQQGAILGQCSHQLLQEAYYVEKSGSQFTAKMSLLAGTTEERMLFSLIAADEAAHLYSVRSFLTQEPAAHQELPFLKLLADIIENSSRMTLVFVVQVVLEGWGITHYRGLLERCCDPDLKAVLQEILNDEYKHHGSGVVLLSEGQLSAREKHEITETMVRFLEMVAVGPTGVVQVVEQNCQGLGTEARKALYEDLRSEETTREKLDLLKKLMAQPGVLDIVEALDKKGCFEPRLN
ncbi:ferritin-like domain-containing protein [bacterium]|nr:ferritin-like domain-containing protein [bacterium]